MSKKIIVFEREWLHEPRVPGKIIRIKDNKVGGQTYKLKDGDELLGEIIDNGNGVLVNDNHYEYHELEELYILLDCYHRTSENKMYRHKFKEIKKLESGIYSLLDVSMNDSTR